MRRTIASIAIFMASALLVTALLVPWLRHDETFGTVRTNIEYTLLLENYCSNFAHPSVVCRTEFIASKVLDELFPWWAAAGEATFVLAVLAAGACFFLPWTRRAKHDAATTWLPRFALFALGGSALMGAVYLGHLPDHRVQRLTWAHGGPLLFAGTVLGLIGVLLWRAEVRTRPRWLALVLLASSAAMLSGGALSPHWLEAHPYNISRGLFTTEICGVTNGRPYCSREDYRNRTDEELLDSRTARSEFGAKLTFRLLIATACVWIAAAISAAMRDSLARRRWLAMASAFAWVIAAGAIARFIFDTSARRGDTFGAGVVMAMSGCLCGLAAIWALARRGADENVESQPAVEPNVYR